MKKIILGLIATITISNLSFGQAVFEHSYATKGLDYERYNSFITQNGVNYFTLDTSTATLLFFNSSHTLFKTVTIPVESGYTLKYITTVNDMLFNSDSLIEFIAFSKNDTNVIQAKLINENGIILQEFGNKQEAKVIKVGTSYKLITMKEVQIPFVTTFEFDVYYLPGTTLNATSNKMEENLFFGYPNPTQNKISIINNLEIGQTGTLEVFDINGKKVMYKNVVGENGEINLDVTDLNEGIYIYKLNGQTNRFVKK